MRWMLQLSAPEQLHTSRLDPVCVCNWVGWTVHTEVSVQNYFQFYNILVILYFICWIKSHTSLCRERYAHCLLLGRAGITLSHPEWHFPAAPSCISPILPLLPARMYCISLSIYTLLARTEAWGAGETLMGMCAFLGSLFVLVCLNIDYYYN